MKNKSQCCNAPIIWKTNETWPYEAVRVCIKCDKECKLKNGDRIGKYIASVGGTK